MTELVDFSANFVDPLAMKLAGFSGAILYMSDRRPGAEWMLAKPATKDYCDSLRAAGLEVVSNYQFGKGATSDWVGGFDGGVKHAQLALAKHLAAGGPKDAPIYAPVDSNPDEGQWNDYILPFLRGWESVIGHDRTGMYANARCIDWALRDGVASWFWQHDWSGDESINGDHPAAHIHQVEIDARQIAGIGVDVNVVLKENYGQWSAFERKAMAPQYTEINLIGRSCSDRDGQRVRYFLLHTQEGNGSAESLAAYLNNTANGVSYHYTLRDRTVVDVVDTDKASWSVLDANAESINLCFAGSRASWTRDQWMAIADDIDIAAYIAVQDAKKYGFPTFVNTPPYVDADGISDHRFVTDQLGIGTHTDVGPGFPWDVFAASVAKYSDSAQTGVITMADFLDLEIENWKGDKVTVRTMLQYIDRYNGLMIDQLLGPDSRTQAGEPTRWPMLGNQTVVEALAQIGEKLGLEGFGYKHATIGAPVADAGSGK